MRRLSIALFVVFLLQSGCIFSPSGSDSPDADSGDAAVNDVADTETDATPDGDADESDACVPMTECAADQCGTVDDGCGGTLDCARECPCQGGEPQQATCGECGLGMLTCGEGEDGLGTCTRPPIPDGTACEDIIYLDTRAADGGDGSLENPFATYEPARAAATSGQTIVIGGNTALASTIELESGVSVIGGYEVFAGNEWVFNPEQKNAVQVPAADGDTFGVRAEGIDEPTWVYGLSVTTDDAVDGEAANNYGFHVHDSVGLTVEFVDVAAGAGGDGADGADGSGGTDGDDGGDATRGVYVWCDEASCTSFDTSGGPGGNNLDCMTAAGGDGGDGGQYNDKSDTLTEPTDGENGADTIGGAGGLNETGERAGEPGESATDRTGQAADGSANDPGGEVTAFGTWSPNGTGNDGDPGEDGSGGGGGGGAATNRPDSHYVGPGGGGGGAGGCGGEGGQGGEAGGGSFGLFLSNSSVTVARSQFSAAAGGRGGAGGGGGLGGEGGAGGNSTSKIFKDLEDTDESVSLNYASGAGGDGADGQDGGVGAGGAGGVSYGGYCHESTLEADEVDFIEGPSATGGASVGNPGPDGPAVAQEGCE